MGQRFEKIGGRKTTTGIALLRVVGCRRGGRGRGGEGGKERRRETTSKAQSQTNKNV